MKQKLSFDKYYSHLDSDVKKQIDLLTKDRTHADKSLFVERFGVENKELGLEADQPQCIGYISRAIADHSEDFMVPSGVNTAIYDLNPIVFFNHMSSGLPIGKCLNIEVVADGVKAQTEFATDVEFSNDIYKLVKGGFLNTFSIGFIALEYHWKGEPTFDAINSEMIKQYPIYSGGAERIITKWLLVEYSIVGIPDNFTAVITDKSIELSDETIKVINPTKPIEKEEKPEEKKIDRTITKFVDRSIKVLPKIKEQTIIKLTDAQKAKIETYYLETKKGKVLRYSISDIVENRV